MRTMDTQEFRLTPEERQEIDCLVSQLDNVQFCWELSVAAVAARCESLDISFEAVFSALFLGGWRPDLFGRILIKTASYPLAGDDGRSAPPVFMDLDASLRGMAAIFGTLEESP